MSRRLLWVSLLIGVVLSLNVSFWLAHQSLVFGSPEGNWFYRYIDEFHGQTIEVFLVCTVLAAGLLSLSWNVTFDRLEVTSRDRLNEWLVVFAWCVCALPLQALLRSPNPFSFGNIFASDAGNSFYSAALKYDAATILRDFDNLRPALPLHAKSNLPGKLLLVQGLVVITSRPDFLAWLVVAISNVGGALMYLFVRDLFSSRRVAFLSLVFYLFMPGKLFFFPLLNTVTPVIVLGAACLLVKWLQTQRAMYAAFLGAAVYGMILFDPASLVMGLLFAALMVRAIWRGDLSLKTLASQTALGAAMFVGTYVFMSAWFGFTLVSALRAVVADAAYFNLATARPYDIWAKQNLIDFLFAIGFCQLVAVPASVLDGLYTKAPVRLTQPAVVIGVSLVAVLVAVDLIGVSRGEVIRLWIFLGCFFQIPAAYICARLDSKLASVAVLAATFLQIVLGSSMVGFIVPG